jgi:hypothetical protein
LFSRVQSAAVNFSAGGLGGVGIRTPSSIAGARP